MAPQFDEYGALKAEQLERIKQRDSFLNLNIIAIGIISTLAVQVQGPGQRWLLLPWVTFILGWAYLINDDKVSAIGAHLRSAMNRGEAQLEWEESEKGFLSAARRQVGEVAVFLTSFVFPAVPALGLFLADIPQGSLGALLLLVAAAELILMLWLTATFLRSIVLRRRARRAA
ncbi:hypothetical protein QQG74_30245 [Micromonospora sp. FIMYZ51]|uniref:hypothetical protein n=1 Tax=Micromonospora sp. FIMYZ51 TaxID=3051832 RepID=UPI00311EA541